MPAYRDRLQLPSAPDARPQARLLLLALICTIILWYIPVLGLLTYPFRIFVTFIHEGGHAIAALLTGNTVHALRVAPNGSGLTYTSGADGLAGLFVASAGYLGTMLYGVLLLALLRRGVAARATLLGSALLVLALTLLYGWFSPFTLVAGVLLALGLTAAARLASPRIATFLVGFLAVQCVVDALFDLRTLFVLSTPFGPAARTDATNMAQATGIPAIVWAVLWTLLALLMLVTTLRAYASPTTRGSLTTRTARLPRAL